MILLENALIYHLVLANLLVLVRSFQSYFKSQLCFVVRPLSCCLGCNLSSACVRGWVGGRGGGVWQILISTMEWNEKIKQNKIKFMVLHHSHHSLHYIALLLSLLYREGIYLYLHLNPFLHLLKYIYIYIFLISLVSHLNILITYYFITFNCNRVLI